MQQSNIKSTYPDIEVILFTGWGLKSGDQVRQIGAYSYIAKPFDAEQLALTIYNAAERKRIRREHRYMEALVTASRALTQTTQIDKQFALAWEFVREQLDVSTFFIALTAPLYNKVYFPLAFDKGQQVNLPELLLAEDSDSWGLAGYVVKTGEEILWSTLEEKEQVCASRKIFPRQEGDPSASCFCVPLVIGDQIRGVLSAQSYLPYVFTSPLQNALRALAGHLSVAVENSRLVSELEQKAIDNQYQAQRIAALEKLAININSNLEVDGILTQTCQVAAEFFHADHSGLVIFDKECVQGVVEAEYPNLGARGCPIPLRGIPLEEQLIVSCKPLIIPVVSEEKGLGEVRDIMLNLGIQSSLFVPVVGKRGLLGSFSLDSTQQTRRFTEDEIELCQIFASQVAIAIENARLYREVQESRDYLHALFSASAEVISPRDPKGVLQSIVFQACHSTGAWRAAILLVDEGGHPQALAYWNFDHHLEAATSIRETGISRRVMASGEPRFIEDTEAESQDVHPAMLAQGVKAAACLPLPREGKIIGVLWIHYREKHPFSDAEKQALQVYVNQSAVAYDNARHIRELEQLREATEAMAREAEPKQVLQRIVEGARRVLGADIALIWSYDSNRRIFIPEELVAEGISEERLEEFRDEEPKAGRTTRHVLEKEYIKVTDVDGSPEIGNPTRTFLRNLGVKSFQSIRLDVAGEPLGVLHVDYQTLRDFGKEERRILEHFAHHAALTLKKARLLTQVKRSREAARVITEVTTLGKLDDTLKMIVKGAKEVLGADIVTLYTFDEKTQRFVQAEGEGYKKRGNLRPPAEVARDSSLWRVIELSDRYYYPADNAPDDRLLQGGFVRNEKVQSALGIQLRFEGERVGVMFVNYRTPHRFTDEEITDALQFANQAAVAIRNVQLHEQTEKQTKTLKGLYDAGKAVTGLLELDKILQSIAEQAWHLVGRQSSYAVIRLVEDELAKVAAVYPVDRQRRKPVPLINLKTGVDGRIGITGRAIKTGQPQLVNDVSVDNDYIVSDSRVRSELAVPITLGARIIGVINVDSPEPQAFTEGDQHTLMSLASYAAIAINNARLHARTSKQAKTLEGLYQAGKAITSTLAVDEVLTRIAEHALDIVGASPQEGCLSHVALCEGNTLRFIAGWPREILADLRKNIGDIDLQNDEKKGIAGYAALEGRSQKVDEVAGNENYIPLRKNVNIHSQLSVPLKIGDKVIGVLSLEHPKPAAFGLDDVHNVELLAAQAAIWIENARLYTSAEQRAKNLGSVLRVSQTIGSSFDLQHILNVACQSAVELLNVDHSGLVLFDEDLTIGRVCAEYPKVGAVDLTFPLRGVPIEEELIASKEPLIVTDVMSEPGFDPVRDVLTKLDTQSILIVPIISKGRILGSFGLDAMKHLRIFTEEDVELCKIFAAQVAVAIDNARQYDELKQTKGLVGARTAMAWTGMMSSTWRHAIEKHAITIREQIELLRSDLAQAPNKDQIEKRLEMMERLANQILQKPLTPPLSAEEATTSVRVNDFVEERTRQLWAHQPYKDVSLDLHLKLENSGSIRASVEWLRRAIDILIDNAVDATEGLPERKIVISSRKVNNRAEILIQDNGHGIPAEVQERLFREPIAKPKGAKGLGMGLLFAQMIVQTFGGEMDVLETGPKGTTMIVSFPLETN